MPCLLPCRGLGESERDPYSLWRRRGRRAPDDRVHLSVNIQLGHAPAGRVVGKADRDRLGALGERHRDFKQLQRRGKERQLYDAAQRSGPGLGPGRALSTVAAPRAGPGHPTIHGHSAPPPRSEPVPSTGFISRPRAGLSPPPPNIGTWTPS